MWSTEHTDHLFFPSVWRSIPLTANELSSAQSDANINRNHAKTEETKILVTNIYRFMYIFNGWLFVHAEHKAIDFYWTCWNMTGQIRERYWSSHRLLSCLLSTAGQWTFGGKWWILTWRHLINVRKKKKNSHREVGLSSSTGKTVPGCEDQLPTG